MSKARRIEALYDAIRDVQDFPKPGIVFKDITPLLGDYGSFKAAVRLMTEPFKTKRVTKVLAIESRGFIFGAPAALALGVPFVPARKAGKLPWRRHRVEYALEYGTDVIEIHEDAITPKDRVLIVDDVLATGGTAAAAIEVVTSIGGRVAGVSFLIELAQLNGRKRLGRTPVTSILVYPRQ